MTTKSTAILNDFKRDFEASILEQLVPILKRPYWQVGDAQCLVGKCRLDQSALGGSKGASSAGGLEGKVLALEDVSSREPDKE